MGYLPYQLVIAGFLPSTVGFSLEGSNWINTWVNLTYLSVMTNPGYSPVMLNVWDFPVNKRDPSEKQVLVGGFNPFETY